MSKGEFNRFKGHSGITKISVAQKEYYTYEYTIGWVCPDPVFFEETFEPAFFKVGCILFNRVWLGN